MKLTTNSTEEKVCELIDILKKRFLEQNKKHSGVFFQLGKDSAYRNLWKKWITVQELFDGKLEFTEERKKDFIDFAIYLLMTCEYLSAEHKSTADRREIKAFCFDSSKGKFVKFDLPKTDVEAKTKGILAKKLFSYQNFELLQTKKTGKLIFVEFAGEKKKKK